MRTEKMKLSSVSRIRSVCAALSLGLCTSIPVTSHVEMTILQSLYTQTSHGFTFLGSSTITGSSDAATTTSYSSQFGLGGWPYHLHIKHLIAFYSGGVAKLVSQTTPGASVDYRLTTAGVPEPSTWALMIVGLGAIGAAMRRRARLGWKHRELKPARRAVP